MQTRHHIPTVLEKTLESAINYPGTGYEPYGAPPCECVDCARCYFTKEKQNIDRYVAVLSDADAKAVLLRYASQIRSDREFLREQIDARGDLLISRWKNKTRQKRAALILQAEPELPKEPFASITFTTPEASWQICRLAANRKMFLLPYLSVEKLSRNTSLLLSLLHHRAYYPPEDWAAFDNKIITNTWFCGGFDVDFNASSVYMHGPKYGQLTPWTKDEAHRADTLGFPRARIVLEAQAMLLGLLRRIVELLLDGSVEQAPSSSKWKEMVSSGFRKTREEAIWSSFALQQFSAPPRLQIDELVMQSKSLMNAAADHLWLLQTEPIYFQGYIRDINKLAVAGILPKDQLHEVYLGEVNHDFNQHQTWVEIHDEFVHASQLHKRYRDSIHGGDPLPKKYDDALGAIEILLINNLHRQIKHLGVVVCQRPGFSKYETVKRLPDGRIHMIANREVLPSIAHAYKSDPLYWCLTNMQGDPENDARHEYGTLFEFLDDHLASAPKAERDRLDAMLYSKLSDLYALVDMLTTLRLSRPQNTNRFLSDVLARDDRLTWRLYRTRAGFTWHKSPLRTQLLERFSKTKPPSGRKGEEWLRDFEALYSNLQAFWDKMHADMEKALKGSKMSPEDVQHRLAPLKMYNSPEHLRLVQQRKDDVLASLNKPKPPAEFDVFLPLPAGPVERFKVSRAGTETKVKTKGEAAVLPTEDLAALTLTTNDDNPPPKIPAMQVTKKTMATIRAMFPQTAEERAKSVDWDVFVASMLDAGFEAHSHGGSAVGFESEEGKIVFHKPHPDPTIHSNMIQVFGKRLNKWFGWTRESFVVPK